MNVGRPSEDERGNLVWPGAVIVSGADLGYANEIHPNAFVGAKATLGRRNVIHPYAVIASESQARTKDRLGGVIVGNGNEFHPFSVVNGASFGDEATRIGDDVIVMQGAHVGHDCVIGDRAIISNHVALAGHVKIEPDAILGAFSAVAQHLTVGRLAHVLPQVAVRRDIWPFETFEGSSPKPTRINSRGLRRMGGTIRDIRAVRGWFNGQTTSEIAVTSLIPCVREAVRQTPLA